MSITVSIIRMKSPNIKNIRKSMHFLAYLPLVLVNLMSLSLDTIAIAYASGIKGRDITEVDTKSKSITGKN